MLILPLASNIVISDPISSDRRRFRRLAALSPSDTYVCASSPNAVLKYGIGKSRRMPAPIFLEILKFFDGVRFHNDVFPLAFRSCTSRWRLLCRTYDKWEQEKRAMVVEREWLLEEVQRAREVVNIKELL